jgi:hypothetical protein
MRRGKTNPSKLRVAGREAGLRPFRGTGARWQVRLLDGSETELAGLAFLDPEVCDDVILTVRGDDVSSP